jgi:hypothetical protein
MWLILYKTPTAIVARKSTSLTKTQGIANSVLWLTAPNAGTSLECSPGLSTDPVEISVKFVIENFSSRK